MSLKKSLLFLFLLNGLSTLVYAAPTVIYGEDNRVDVDQTDNDFFRELSLSTAAMISKGKLTHNESSSSYSISGSTLQENGMCETERFAEQITAARCSGFLVGEDTLVTAGHCLRNQYDCDNYSWVFDFKWNSTQKAAYAVDQDSVYNCKEIVKITYDYQTKDDYAVIHLDRKVIGREPLKFRKEGKIETQAPLVVIGHPSGLPTKIADGANVRSIEPDAYFIANLDTYGGNSGSAVLDADTGFVEGILVRGETDYIYDRERQCRRSKVCTDDGCRGEDVTRITNIKEIMNL